MLHSSENTRFRSAGHRQISCERSTLGYSKRVQYPEELILLNGKRRLLPRYRRELEEHKACQETNCGRRGPKKTSDTGFITKRVIISLSTTSWHLVHVRQKSTSRTGRHSYEFRDDSVTQSDDG